MGQYAGWLKEEGRSALQPNLAAWRDSLSISPRSQVSYLSSVRAAYRRLLKDDRFRSLAYEYARAAGLETPADQKAFVDELDIRIRNAIDPDRAPVNVIEEQDEADEKHLRLTQAQAEAFLEAPGVATTMGLRDTAIIAILLCTGIREGELRDLEVEDLRQHLGGELSLYVRNGKGNKARMVPYGELDWCLVIVDHWLEEAAISEGPVFRGLYKGGKLRPGKIGLRSIAEILAQYPISVDGEKVVVKPHDCRRTYARRLHDAYLKLAAIQQNLGHKDIATTLGYIGELDAGQRRAKAIYSYDLNKLEAV
jgi:integrase